MNTLAQTVDLGLLVTESADFYATPGGFLGLRHGGEDYPRVTLRRALPHGNPWEYICVADPENKEICIIKDVAALPGPQKELVQRELGMRYYCPVIVEVKSVRNRMGYVFLEVALDDVGHSASSATRTISVRDVSRNVRLLSEDVLAINDVDGNRYLVPSLCALDGKSQRRLEPYLF
ncbi:MAG: DUF1854 domain-containing protein [Clostridia bacterium]|nr:DUF1854 domain-containing protein [Clostridia bacterium]